MCTSFGRYDSTVCRGTEEYLQNFRHAVAAYPHVYRCLMGRLVSWIAKKGLLIDKRFSKYINMKNYFHMKSDDEVAKLKPIDYKMI